jgi:quinol monooxygenase YgiN
MVSKIFSLMFVGLFLSISQYGFTEVERENSMKVNVVITFNVKANKLESFKDIMNDVKTNLPTVDGCDSVQIFNDNENSAIFTLVEEWSSKELHKNHLNGVVESGGWNYISQHLTADPVSSYFTQI